MVEKVIVDPKHFAVNVNSRRYIPFSLPSSQAGISGSCGIAAESTTAGMAKAVMRSLICMMLIVLRRCTGCGLEMAGRRRWKRRKRKTGGSLMRGLVFKLADGNLIFVLHLVDPHTLSIS